MKRDRVFLAVCLPLLAFAQVASAQPKDCRSGKFGAQTYQVLDEGMDTYGNYRTRIVFSRYGELTGKGRYFATQEEAALEARYSNRKTGYKAVVSTSFQDDASFFTLCAGTDLRNKQKYTCISCVDHR